MQESILRFFQSVQSNFLDTFFTYITMLGEQYFIIMIVAWVYWNHSKKDGFILTFLFLMSGMVNVILKDAFHTQRPFQKLDNFDAQRISTAEGHSFPSGHTQGATLLFLSLAKIFRTTRFMVFAIIISLLVAVSRMYLGCHWPIDVIGGFILAALIVFLLFDYFSRLYDNKEKFRRLVISVLAAFYLVLLIVLALNEFYLDEKIEIVHYFKLVGIATGALIAFIIEEKHFPFSVEAKRPVKYLRFVLGLGITIGMMAGLKLILPENAFGYLLRYFLVGAWISGIFPILGQKVGLFASCVK